MNDKKALILKQLNKVEELPREHNSITATKGIYIARLCFFLGVTSVLSGTFLLLWLQQTIFFLVLLIIGFILWLFGLLIRKSIGLTQSPSGPLIENSLQRLQQITKQVSKCKFLEHVEKYGEQAALQAHILLQQYKNLITILPQKFEPTELTFNRYLDSINSSCFSIGETLLQVKNILENRNILLNQNSDQNCMELNEVIALLKNTDKALEALAILFKSLNNIHTKEHYRDELEQSVLQLHELAERAKIYSKD